MDGDLKDLNAGAGILADAGALQHRVPEDVLTDAQWRRKAADVVQALGVNIIVTRHATLPVPERRAHWTAAMLHRAGREWFEQEPGEDCDVLQIASDEHEDI